MPPSKKSAGACSVMPCRAAPATRCQDRVRSKGPRPAARDQALVRWPGHGTRHRPLAVTGPAQVVDLEGARLARHVPRDRVTLRVTPRPRSLVAPVVWWAAYRAGMAWGCDGVTLLQQAQEKRRERHRRSWRRMPAHAGALPR